MDESGGGRYREPECALAGTGDGCAAELFENFKSRGQLPEIGCEGAFLQINWHGELFAEGGSGVELASDS
jgi:hypothetical protein